MVVSFWYLTYMCYDERSKAVRPVTEFWAFNLCYMAGRASRKADLTQLTGKMSSTSLT